MAEHTSIAGDIARKLVIAIDGPAGSGKSTTARSVARRLGLRHVDTGAMYRAVALAALRSGADLENAAVLEQLADTVTISFRESTDGQTVLLDGADVTTDIRTPEVTKAVSPVSAEPAVRKAMVRQQRRLASEGGVVLEGRDIGTVVLPSAEVKVYLIASTRVRAARRQKDMAAQGVSMTLEEVENDIVGRDEYDSSRAASPLRRAVGAVEVDTSELSIEGQVERVVEIARDTTGRLSRIAVPSCTANPYRKKRWIYAFSCGLIRGVLRTLFGMRVRRWFDVEYKENYIFACNHRSYVDPPFVGSTLSREVHFLARASLFRNPLFGWLIRSFNAIPLKRGAFDKETLTTALSLLRAGRSIMIFPEGTRSRDGRFKSPKNGIGFLALHSGVAVIPVYARGNGSLRGAMHRRNMCFVHGAPIRVHPDAAEDFCNSDGYGQFAEMVMEGIKALADRLEHSAS